MTWYQPLRIRWNEGLNRAEWDEDRPDEGFFTIIAEKEGSLWSFWGRYSWVAHWHPLPSCPDRVATAEKAFERHSDGQNLRVPRLAA